MGPKAALAMDSKEEVPFRDVGSPAAVSNSLKQKSEKLATTMISRGPNRAFPAFWNASGNDKDPPPTMVDRILKRADDIVPIRSSFPDVVSRGNDASSGSGSLDRSSFVESYSALGEMFS